MRAQSSKSKKFMKYISLHPDANVKELAAKLGITASLGYQLRKKAQDRVGGFAPPEMVPMPPAQDVNSILNVRANNYGKFKDGAALMQAIKRELASHAAKHDKTFADDQWEALEMIVHKIGRIVNGNPNKADSWDDIAGYAKLVSDRIRGVVR